MEEIKLLEKYPKIFEKLSEYVLVGTESSTVILNISTMSFCLFEEDYLQIKDLMIRMGVKTVQSTEEVRSAAFEQFHNIWDEEKKEFERVSQTELNKILAERAQRKNKK